MATAGTHARHPEGRLLTFYRLDVHVEARRLGATAFDLLIILMTQIWINDVFGVTRVLDGAALRPVGGGYGYLTTATTVDVAWLALYVVLYYSVQEALFGATCGKLVAGIRVVSLDGRHPSPAAILVRNILRIVDYWPTLYLLGIVVARLSPRRQRLGDYVAQTLVVRAESAVLAYYPRSQLRRRFLGLAGALAAFVAFSFGFSYYGRPPLVIAGLVNTHQLFYGINPGGYTLGTPHWSSGTVAYPLRYRITRTGRACNATITLSWHGFFTLGGGWVLASAVDDCLTAR